MKIAIIGAGAYGTALGGILVENGHEIEYYDPKLTEKTLPEIISNKDYVLLSAPSVALPIILPELSTKAPLIVATKGILNCTPLENFDDVIALSGPGFAEDIKNHKKTILTMTDKRIDELFSTDYLTFDFTTDFKGVLLCGALKNIYAILAGMKDLKVNSEKWEEFIIDTCAEMKLVLKENGASPETVDLSCGVGDLRLTCNYPSRNYEFGQILRSNASAKPEKTVEGVSALFEVIRGALVVPKTANKLQSLIEIAKEWN